MLSRLKILAIILVLAGSSHAHAQKDMDESAVGMAYVCWQLANQSGLEEDSDLFAKAISFIRKSPEFTSSQHFEYMGYAAKQVLDLDDSERESIYKIACLEPLKNIERAVKQGMLD